MSTSIQSSDPVLVSGTYVHPNDALEHDLVEVTNAGRPRRVTAYVDISAITNGTFRIRFYAKIDGTNYRLIQTNTYPASDEVVLFDFGVVSFDIKITADSGSAEGATRNLPYRVYT